MKLEEYQKINDSIKSKLSKEDFAKISDDLGTLRINNDILEKTIVNKDESYNKLNEYKEQLLVVNANLQLQKPVGNDDDIPQDKPSVRNEPEASPLDVSLNDCFDKKGRFI